MSFFAVTNLANEPIVVETAFYMGTLNVRIMSEVRTIPGHGNLPIIDPTDATRFPGVAGTAGLVVVTPVVNTVDIRPVVPPSPPGDVTGGRSTGASRSPISISMPASATIRSRASRSASRPATTSNVPPPAPSSTGSPPCFSASPPTC